MFNLLKRLKFLRNTPFNIFGYSLERKKEKMLLIKFIKCLDFILKNLNNNNYKCSLELIDIFNQIRGFGHVKMKNFKKFDILYNEKFNEFKKASKKKELAAE